MEFIQDKDSGVPLDARVETPRVREGDKLGAPGARAGAGASGAEGTGAADQPRAAAAMSNLSWPPSLCIWPATSIPHEGRVS